METLHTLINFVLHLDHHLGLLVSTYGLLAYGILCLIIFCETGLVVTPFLPGDSLLFATGALAASSESPLNIHLLFILLSLASITGNLVNYAAGRFIGPRIFQVQQSWFFNPTYLTKAHRFYEQHGGQALIIARFIPIIRTFAPFVAGIGAMQVHKFLFYNILGALLWIGGLLYSSYLFGNLPFVREHFSSVVMIIIAASLLPPLLGFIKHRYLTQPAQ